MDFLSSIKNKFLMQENASAILSYSTSNEQLEQKLSELGINISNIKCVGCRKSLAIKDISGLHRIQDEYIFFCDKFECQLDASHKLLEITK